MDIKEKIEELVEKIKNDKDLASKIPRGNDFENQHPIGTVEKLLGVDLPNDQIEKLVEGIQAKISLDKLGGMLGGLFGKK